MTHPAEASLRRAIAATQSHIADLMTPPNAVQKMTHAQHERLILLCRDAETLQTMVDRT